MPNEPITPDGNIPNMENAEVPSPPIEPVAIESITPVAEPVVENPSNTPTLETKVDDAPSTEDGDDKVVDFNQFLEASGKNKIETTPPVEPTKKEGQEVIQPTVDKVKDGQRDYTGIDEKDVTHFKRMSNDAFAAFKPVYQEHKKLKTEITEKETKLKELDAQFTKLKTEGPQLPESYFENQHAYLLDPEFQSNVRDLNQVSAILQHWNKQYEAVAEGSAEFDFIDFNQKTGQLEIVGKIPANKGSEAKLLSYINHAQNLVNNQQAKLQSSVQTHQYKHNESTKKVTSLRTSFFNGFYKSPEDKAIYEPLIKEKLEMLPPAFRNNPLAQMTAESLVMNQVLAQLLNNAAKEKATNTAPITQPTKVKPVVPPNRLNPTAAQINGDGNDGKPNKNGEVTFDDFQKAKEGLL